MSDDTRSGVEPAAAATQWFARLRAADCSAQERAAFERWRTDPACARAYASTERMWAGLAQLRDDDELRSMAQQALRMPPRRRALKRLGLALAASLVAGMLVLGDWSGAGLSGQVYQTAFGETRTEVLTDGSSLTLNFDARANVQFGDKLRQVKLRQGEALFDVQSDAGRPFVVSTDFGEVRALGTRFTVRRERQAIVVTLLEGSVSVASPRGGEMAFLEPGERLILAGDGAVQRQRIDPDLVASWTRGRLVFRAVPLAQVLEEVNRYARPGIVLGEQVATDTPISGTVRVGDAASMAAALGGLLHLRVARAADGGFVLRHP